MDRYVTEYLDARLPVFDVGVLKRVTGPGPVARLRSWQKKRRAIRDLEALDDRLLADIGVERGDIRPVIDGLYGAANDNMVAAAA